VKKLPSDQQVNFLMALLVNVVSSIVEHGEDVSVGLAQTPARVIFTVRVHHADMGLVIGEGGKTGDAIRRIVWTAAKKTDRRVDIDFM
jgi:predicted RNA-binding protein YlqC (UPF0109 family)